jgi:hypothetical protein
MMLRRFLAILMFAMSTATMLVAQPGMPDLRQMSGTPLPAADLPIGSVSVRVIRGAVTNNVPGVDVEFLVNGQARTTKTDDGGRAVLTDLPQGTRVKASVVVDGERVESQEITIGQSGIRFMLVAGLGAAPAAAPVDVVKGAVVFGPGSRVIAEFTQDKLNIYYVLSILNSAASAVDIGGPVTLDLPTGARGVVLLEGSTPQAKAIGAHVIVTGPFSPGATRVNLRFEMPHSGPSVTLEQRWPAPLQQVQVFALKTNGLEIASPQIGSQQSVMEQGQPLIIGMGPPLAAGQTFSLQVSGLPYHPQWPRYVALGTAAVIMTCGIWAAIVAPTRRRGQAA